MTLTRAELDALLRALWADLAEAGYASGRVGQLRAARTCSCPNCSAPVVRGIFYCDRHMAGPC